MPCGIAKPVAAVSKNIAGNGLGSYFEGFEKDIFILGKHSVKMTILVIFASSFLLCIFSSKLLNIY